MNRLDKFLTYETDKKFTRKNNNITVGKIKIFFFSGSFMKMSGTSPHFYISDDAFASDFLKMEGYINYAQKLTGLNDLFDLIKKGSEEHENH